MNYSPEHADAVMQRLKQDHEKANDYQIGGMHYKTMEIEPWELLQGILTPEQWKGYLIGNAIKYGMRQGRKVDADDDPDKARHYIRKLNEGS